jgi:hypothetical protein
MVLHASGHISVGGGTCYGSSAKCPAPPHAWDKLVQIITTTPFQEKCLGSGDSNQPMKKHKHPINRYWWNKFLCMMVARTTF